MSTKTPETDAAFGMRHVTVVPTNFRKTSGRDRHGGRAAPEDEEGDADRE